MRWGLGLRLRVTVEAGALVFRDAGYVWRMAGCHVPLPLHWLLGRTYVEERPATDGPRAFTMCIRLRHPWWGDVMRCARRFSLDGRSD